MDHDYIQIDVEGDEDSLSISEVRVCPMAGSVMLVPKKQAFGRIRES